jgi:hypothetical protein
VGAVTVIVVADRDLDCPAETRGAARSAAAVDAWRYGAPVVDGFRGRAAVVAAIAVYTLVAALCRPLTGPALGAVLVAGLPLCWLGVRRRPGAGPVDGRSAIVWAGIAGVAAAYELVLWLGRNDADHPTLSTLADPVLATYPGRVVGYLLWLGAGAWLVSR